MLQFGEGQPDSAFGVAILAIGHVEHPENTILDRPILAQPMTASGPVKWIMQTQRYPTTGFLTFPIHLMETTSTAPHPSTQLEPAPTKDHQHVGFELVRRHLPVFATLQAPIALVVGYGVGQRLALKRVHQ